MIHCVDVKIIDKQDEMIASVIISHLIKGWV